MASERPYDPDLEWIDHVRPTGLVVAGPVLKERQLVPTRQTAADTAAVAALIETDPARPSLAEPWPFFTTILGWRATDVAGAPGGPPLPADLAVMLPEQSTTLAPDWAMAAPKGESGWQLLVTLVGVGIDPDQRGTADGWEATAHQRFERLLRETGVATGIMISDNELRLIHAPRGETSGWLPFPLRDLTTVAGRIMLGGLKLLLHSFRLHNDVSERRLPQVLKASREAQARVSVRLAEQVLGARHELLRGFDHAEPALIRELARSQPHHLYEGLLTVLLRLVFLLYAEDRDLVPSRTDGPARALYQANYSVRGLFAKLEEDAALNPDTMDERTGAWGRLLATFRLLHEGDRGTWIRARGGTLFDRRRFRFLEGRAAATDPERVPAVSDGCVHRVLTALMTLAGEGGVRERLSYRTLDVEQIGSVYETVMGFTVDVASGTVLAIKAGKNNRTPVFVDLDALAARKGTERIKSLKEDSDRGGLSAKQDKAIKDAKSAADLAAALDSLVDERASPGKHPAAAGTPILQPTAERRRTGSHYTPRELTEPIVRHALEPVFARLGPDATPEQVLELKVCDPAMGSGAFLVEACRALAQRLVQAWARHPGTRPVLPADEDDDLHARRLIAQRCLYGVDKNPMAADLARLSLWLATLARDHEFTFLDHALKCGDSLVGLTVEQMSRLRWDDSVDGMPLYAGLIRERVQAALAGREEIRTAPDNVTAAVQEVRFRAIESRLDHARAIGDAVIAAFFASDKGRAREQERAEVEQALNGNPPDWAEIKRRAAALRRGDTPLSPFHWELEFPEVFQRNYPGFDAFVGNPPFLGGRRITAELGSIYNYWLEMVSLGGSRNADIGAHFYRRCFTLLRAEGSFGLIATKTIRQGDTRDTGLRAILASGGTIARAQRRIRWPGEAAVVIAVVHVQKGPVNSPILDDKPVPRISAYLVAGNRDDKPAALAANAGKVFIGQYILGDGFTFDDTKAAKGTASSLAEMRALIDKDPRNAERIEPYLGGEEANNDPQQQQHRYIIDFADFPLVRRDLGVFWENMDEAGRRDCRARGIAPLGYNAPVASDWPELLEIVRRLVLPVRKDQKRQPHRERWWQFADKRPGLRAALKGQQRCFGVNCKATPHMAFARLKIGPIFAHSLVICVDSRWECLSTIQSRIHEIWARFFSSSLKDDLQYTPTACFRTFPFPPDWQGDAALAAIGEAYHTHRAAMMVKTNKGLTKTYNRFHLSTDRAADIVRLRELHAEMDAAVLHAYGWHDLAETAAARFLTAADEDDHTYQGRLFWPAEVRDEVLARLLALNAERHTAELADGVAPAALEGEDDNGDDEPEDAEFE